MMDATHNHTPELALRVQDLKAHVRTAGGVVRAVDGISFDLRDGETYALVGESGSGKSMTALAIMGLLPHPAGFIAGGQVLFEGCDLLALPPVAMRGIRGNQISMIFQEPMTALNPVFTVGNQIIETIRLHQRATAAAAARSAAEMLDAVGIPEPQQRMREFPHQLSGGMRQRVMIAMALACRPRVLIADEPTTALDVTIQAQILDLIRTLRSSLGSAVLLITHDMGVVYEHADRVGVMRRGVLVEQADRHTLFQNPRHAYTRMLLDAVPRLHATGQSEFTTEAPAPRLQVRNLKMHFPIRKGLLRRTVGHVKAVDGVSLALHGGETLALVGESGCGKTTVGKCIVRLLNPSAGDIEIGGRNIAALGRGSLRPLRRRVQMVFQDPYSSLNPRMRIGDILTEGMLTHGIGSGPRDRLERATMLLDQVGLAANAIDRYPHEFSGGQRQRVGIARALAVEPDVLICDEATSSLDVSVQAQVLDLLESLQERLGLAYLFISHDLAVVRRVAHRVAVMYKGQIVEEGPCHQIIDQPQHAYTRQLIAAVPAVRD